MVGDLDELIAYKTGIPLDDEQQGVCENAKADSVQNVRQN